MRIFEKYLTIWVGISILLGLFLGNNFNNIFINIANYSYANINLIIAVLIWIMIYPMMLSVDFKCIKKFWRKPRGLYLTIFINWIIKPFSMAGIGILFFHFIFKDFVTTEDANSYIAGMILLGVAPCTAMVFIWSRLVNGDPNYTLLQVSINDLILILAFPIITKILLGVTGITIPWSTLIGSVVLYIVTPLVAAAITRYFFLSNKEEKVNKLIDLLKPFSILGLLLTITILFGLQADKINDKPFIMLLISIPLIIQTIGIFAITYFLAFKLSIPYNIAAPAALIGTSNFFELAVAVAISLFGLDSGAALATVVGVLVEVPIMLLLVNYANRTKHYFKEI
ncbi:MAG: ACR3 family arsenite efflux transporter [Gammaproteobacteria bacterium]|nr:ACR3 family arsenite efflux transporter [Gammaproteobacteria bacterium]MBT6755038.1 ACR3 family arsenite efflux transporter [Gammaproteobacteria bacterium]